ncbi:MAG: sce7726 family protein [Lachnospiraceae bacterium]|nr:sce7726 family protein [Lachnospiraceae bacterium]
MLHDKDIREPLFDYLDEVFGKTRVMEEKMMGKSRADVIMVIEDAVVGIEIKSDADTYTRLKTQIKDYDRYFDYNFIVVGTAHAMHVKEHVPEHWGIITVEEVDGKPDFYMYREAILNDKAEILKKMELLWRPELAMLQEKYGMPKYANLGKDKVRAKIVAFMEENLNTLNHDISELLFERDYEQMLADIAAYRKALNPRRRGPKKRTSVRRTRKRSE